MEIIVFRHGIAIERDEAAELGLSDADRALTGKGHRRTRAAARGLRSVLANGGDTVVVSSPLLRARQTAEIVADCLGDATLEETAALRPGAGVDAVDRYLSECGPAGRCILVGHEPDLSTWTSWAMTGRDRPIVTFKKAGACRIDFPNAAEPGEGTLRWLLTAGQLRALV